MKSSRSQSSKGKSASGGRSATKSASSNGRASSKSTASKSGSSNGSSGSKKNATSARGSRSTASTKAKSSGGAAKSRSRSTAMEPREGLEKVFKDCLKDIFYAEKQLYKALNKLAKGAANEELSTAFETHRDETEQQIGKLEQVFEMMEMRAQGKKCPAMDGLIEESNEHLEEMEEGPARDAALIVGAQKVEHYEMAAYGSLRAFANTLGYVDCATIFEEILQQESTTDEKLTQIAMVVNQEAMGAGGEGEEEGSETQTADQGQMEEA